MNTVQIQATGASGGYGYQSSNRPGSGSTVSGTLSGVSGQLDVCVNVGGGTVNQGPQGAFYGGDGGGASGVSVGSDFSHPVLIAGGGGGGGGNPPGESNYQSGAGGHAGYPSGTDGVVSFTSSNNNFACGGTGGSQTGPGTCSAFPETTGGATTSGGPGGGGNESGAGAAGGGAGYYGGGAGLAGGGGGGSDLCTEGTANLAMGALWSCSETTASGSPGVSLTFSYSNPNPAVYLAEPNNGQVVEQAPYSGPLTTVAGGLSNPQGTAVDPAGNVFIADTNNNQVVEIPAGGGAQTTIDTNVSQPWGVAVDTAGNVFIADANNSRVVELPAGGGPAVTIADNLGYPQAVAVDPLGDVFIADSANNDVIEVPAGSAQPATANQKITIASGLNDPAGVAVNTAGDVFIANRANFQGNGSVLEVLPGGQTKTIGAFGVAMGVALDAAGNLYVSDEIDGVVEVPADGSAQITVINPGNNLAGVAVAAPPPTFTADTPPDLAPQGQTYSIHLHRDGLERRARADVRAGQWHAAAGADAGSIDGRAFGRGQRDWNLAVRRRGPECRHRVDDSGHDDHQRRAGGERRQPQRRTDGRWRQDHGHRHRVRPRLPCGLRLHRGHIRACAIARLFDGDSPSGQRHRGRDRRHRRRDELHLVSRPVHLRRDADGHRSEPRRRVARGRHHSHDHRHRLRARRDGRLRSETRHLGELQVRHPADRDSPVRQPRHRRRHGHHPGRHEPHLSRGPVRL